MGARATGLKVMLMGARATGPKVMLMEFREGQFDMVVDILNALERGTHIAIEAGVGIGKTFGYLAPLLLYSKYMKIPIVIATSSINLQEQLEADARRLMEMLGLDIHIQFAKGRSHYVCQYRANRYLMENSKPELMEVQAQIEEGCCDRREFKTEIPNGIWDKINIRQYKRSFCAGKCALSDQCHYYNMRRGLLMADFVICNQDLLTAHLRHMRSGMNPIINERFKIAVIDEAHNLENKVRSAVTVRFNDTELNKVITDSMNSVDQMTRAVLSPDATRLQGLIEELFIEIRRQRQQQINESKMRDRGERKKKRNRKDVVPAVNAGDRDSNGSGEARTDEACTDETRTDETRTDEARTDEARADEARTDEAHREQPAPSSDTNRFFFRDVNGAYKKLTTTAGALYNFNDRLMTLISYKNDDRRGRQEANEAGEKLEEYAEGLIRLAVKPDKYIIWSSETPSGTVLNFCPQNISDITRHMYFDGNYQTILTSATLTNSRSGALEEQYGYFLRNTGFPAAQSVPSAQSVPTAQSVAAVQGIRKVQSVTAVQGIPSAQSVPSAKGILADPKASPFDYGRNAMIYVAGDMPHPNTDHEKYIKRGTERLKEILEISHGRALVLFTSKEDMKEVERELKAGNPPYRILVQQNGSSQAKVLKKFREDVDSVLLGTGAYWEGISVEGLSLSNVVIFRLPFPVPDPVIEYKTRHAKDGLMDVLVPEMILKLEQGVGRLIRSAADKGIISIIDSRLSEKAKSRYRELVWGTLPIKNRTEDLEVLKTFYGTVVEGKEGAEDEDGDGDTNDANDGC